MTDDPSLYRYFCFGFSLVIFAVRLGGAAWRKYVGPLRVVDPAGVGVHVVRGALIQRDPLRVRVRLAPQRRNWPSKPQSTPPISTRTTFGGAEGAPAAAIGAAKESRAMRRAARARGLSARMDYPALLRGQEKALARIA